MDTTAKVIKIVLAATAVVVLVLLLIGKLTANRLLLPDRAPSEIEENADISTGGGEKMDAPPDGGGLRLNYTKEVTIDLAAGSAALYFENGSESLHDVSIFLTIQDTLILQSGLLPPGSTLRTLPLPPEGVPLQRGGYDGTIIVQCYDENGVPLTVNSALQNIAIEVK